MDRSTASVVRKGHYLFLGIALLAAGAFNLFAQTEGYEVTSVRHLQVTARLHVFFSDYMLAKTPDPSEFEIGIEALDAQGARVDGLECEIRNPSWRAGMMPLKIEMKLTDDIKKHGAEISAEKVRVFVRTKDWKLLYERVVDMKLEFTHDPEHKRHGGSGGSGGGGGLGGSGEPFKGPPADNWSPNMKVSVEWEMTEGDASYKKLKDVLKAFNKRLYDCTDGQVWIAKFEIYDASTSVQLKNDGSDVYHPNPPGAAPMLFHHGWPEQRANKGAVGEAMVGSPKEPGNAYIGYFDSIDAKYGDVDNYAGVVVHEFSHGTFGVLDEYFGPNGGAKCPDDKKEADEKSCCIMCDPYHYREMCRDDAHDPNHDTNQDFFLHMSCYDAMVKRLLADVNVKIVMPEKRILGPIDPPDAVFEDHLD